MLVVICFAHGFEAKGIPWKIAIQDPLSLTENIIDEVFDFWKSNSNI